MSGDGIHSIAVGAAGAAFHCFSRSVLLKIAGIDELSGASIVALWFRATVAVLFPRALFDALDGTEDSDLLAQMNSFNSQPVDSPVSGNSLDGTVAGFGTDV